MSVVCSELPLYKWVVCGDLKVVGVMLVFQGGHTMYLCLLCLWDSRADDQYHIRQEWPSRQGLKPASHNVLSHPLVEPSKTLISPLHIKLGLMKNFVKTLDREDRGLLSSIRGFNKKSCRNLWQIYLMVSKQENSSRTLALMMHWILLNSLPGCPLNPSLWTSLVTTEFPNIKSRLMS